MNCCWILLLLLFSGRGGCGSAASCNSNNCSCGQRETRNAGRRTEQENGCGREEVRPELRSRMENREGCDVASTIPQPWQEYAKRDSEDCQD